MNHMLTAGTGSRFDPVVHKPHHFAADGDDPGYRPHCLVCSLERGNHPRYAGPASESV